VLIKCVLLSYKYITVMIVSILKILNKRNQRTFLPFIRGGKCKSESQKRLDCLWSGQRGWGSRGLTGEGGEENTIFHHKFLLGILKLFVCDIITQTFDSYQILFSSHEQNQNHVINLIEHTMLLFCKLVYSMNDIQSNFDPLKPNGHYTVAC
jgi:hypothetical protein